MTSCDTQTVRPLQMDNMAGLQKHSRTKAAARYIVFPSRLFLNFCKTAENIMLSEINVFPFLDQTNISGISGYQSAFPGLQLCQALQRFSFSYQSRPAKALSCDLPTRDRISSKRPRRNMACRKYPSPVSNIHFDGSKPDISEASHWPVETLPDGPII